MTIQCSRCGVETDHPKIVFTKPAYSLRELAAVVGLTPQAIRWHIQIGLLAGRFVGTRRVIVTAEDAYAWLSERDDWEELARHLRMSFYAPRGFW